MRILEIEKLFQDEKGLIEVLNKCEEDFNKIDYYANLLKQRVANNPEQCKSALLELTGIYMSLNPILSTAITEKKNREERYYDSYRIEIENKGEKFTSAIGERKASLFIAEYRRIRNILQGYVNSCEKGISTLQSMLKYFGEEVKLNK